MLLRKNKFVEQAVKEEQQKYDKDPYIYNYEGHPIMDIDTGKFFYSFADYTKEQELIIKKALTSNYSVAGWAYVHVPPVLMQMIVDRICTNPLGDCKVKDFDIWKLTHSYAVASERKFMNCLDALTYGVSIIDGLSNVSVLDDEIIDVLVEAASNGKNICKYVNDDTDAKTLRAMMLMEE